MCIVNSDCLSSIPLVNLCHSTWLLAASSSEWLVPHFLFRRRRLLELFLVIPTCRMSPGRHGLHRWSMRTSKSCSGPERNWRRERDRERERVDLCQSPIKEKKEMIHRIHAPAFTRERAPQVANILVFAVGCVLEPPSLLLLVVVML